MVTIYTSAPNNAADNFTNNDTIQSFVFINNTSIAAPFKEEFSGNTFPPANWTIWNPQANVTWTKSITAGFAAAWAGGLKQGAESAAGQSSEWEGRDGEIRFSGRLEQGTGGQDVSESGLILSIALDSAPGRVSDGPP